VIYFAQSLDGGAVKIGFSDDVDARRQQLELHYGCPLALLATMEGGREQETAIHRRFRSLRFGRTEQFRPTSELMAFIGRPLLVGPNPDAVEAMAGRAPNAKPVRLDLDPELHQKLRVVAAEQGKPMAVFAREIVEETVNKLYGERRGR
jgi:hypothetical protein